MLCNEHCSCTGLFRIVAQDVAHVQISLVVLCKMFPRVQDGLFIVVQTVA